LRLNKTLYKKNLEMNTFKGDMEGQLVPNMISNQTITAAKRIQSSRTLTSKSILDLMAVARDFLQLACVSIKAPIIYLRLSGQHPILQHQVHIITHSYLLVHIERRA